MILYLLFFLYSSLKLIVYLTDCNMRGHEKVYQPHYLSFCEHILEVVYVHKNCNNVV